MNVKDAHKALEAGQPQKAIAIAMIVQAEMAITQAAILRELVQNLNYVAQNTCRIQEELEDLLRLMEGETGSSVRMILQK